MKKKTLFGCFIAGLLLLVMVFAGCPDPDPDDITLEAIDIKKDGVRVNDETIYLELDGDKKTVKLTAEKIPSNTTVTDAISWSSDDTDVASVSPETGSEVTITAVSKGIAVITASLGGISAEVTITTDDPPDIRAVPVAGVFIDLDVGTNADSGAINATVDITDIKQAEIRFPDSDGMPPSMVKPFGDYDPEDSAKNALPVIQTLASLEAATWMALGGQNPGITTLTIRPDELVDGKTRNVARFHKISNANVQNVGMAYRFLLPASTVDKYYYVSTYIKLISGLPAQPNYQYRLGVSEALTTVGPGVDGDARMIITITAAGIKPLTNDWQEFSFIVRVPAEQHGKWFEVRTTTPPGNAITAQPEHDVTAVEMYEVELVTP